MKLSEEIEAAESVVSKILPHYANPVVMSSFGKDSMVMLDIIKRMGHRFSIIFHQEPFFPEKLKFARSIIEAEGYDVYDYPPSGVTVIQNDQNGNLGFVKYMSVGRKFMRVALDVMPPEDGKPYLCGLRDIYHRPTVPSFDFPWDLVFIGHKSSDTDRVYGPVPLSVDLKMNEGGPDYLYPLRYFNDEDIWNYHLEFKLPINLNRYDPQMNFQERKDITFNNDKFHVCMKCMDRKEPAFVQCPLVKQEINNISAEIDYDVSTAPLYAGGKD